MWKAATTGLVAGGCEDCPELSHQHFGDRAINRKNLAAVHGKGEAQGGLGQCIELPGKLRDRQEPGSWVVGHSPTKG